METRSRSKRAASGEANKAAIEQPPAKRTRANSRQAGQQATPAPPAAAAAARAPRKTAQHRSNRGGRQVSSKRSLDSADTAPQPESAPDQPSAQQDEPIVNEACQPAAAAGGDMDRSNRRASRQEASAGDEERDNGDMFGRNLGAAAGSALQGLLRKLGANFEDMLPMGVSGTRIKGIISGLKQADDDSAQLTALTDLCELLSISTEESLTTFPVDQIVPLLVQLLGAEHNPDIMLLAARALTYMADVPGLTSSIVRHGAVPAFCARLLTIEYIDLAEQSLQALEKLSHEHPGSLLQAGGLMAVLSYLDFFPSSVQRTAVATAAMMCTALGPSHVSAVRDALPVLCNLLQYSDPKVVDNACLALLHVAEAYSHNGALLEQLQEAGLINQALQLISSSAGAEGAGQTSVATYFGMIKLLSTCASGSAAIVEQLLKAGVVDTLQQLLAHCALLGSSGSISGGPAIRTPDQLLEVMTLAHELLPAVPDASAMLLLDLPTHPVAGEAGGAGAAAAAAAGRAGAAATSSNNKALTDFLRSDPTMVMNMCQSLMPLTLQVHSSTVMGEVRSRCLGTIVKLLAVATPAQLEQALADLPISSFVASLLSSRDVKAQAAAIQMAEILMAKLPHIFASFFVKEGVAHALERLAATSPAAAATAAAAAIAVAGQAASAGGSGPRRSSSGAAGTSLLPPSPPVTRSRRSSRTDQGKEDAAAVAPAPAPAPAAPAAAAGAVASLRTPSGSLRDAVARRASSLTQQHFQPGSQAANLETEGLQQLRQLSEQLCKDDTCVTPLLESITSSSVSVFEMITSGAISRITDYLQGNDLPPSARRDEQLLCRLRTFTAAALAVQQDAGGDSSAMDVDGAPSAAAATGAAGAAAAGSVPLTGLVRKLQGALASAEAFPVACRSAGVGGGGLGGSARSLGRSAGMSGSFNRSAYSSGLNALAQPFKLRLVRHGQEATLKEYPNNIVLIEPLANMTAIEDFLWPRVNKGSSLDALRAQAAAAETAAAAGKGPAAGVSSRPDSAGLAAAAAEAPVPTAGTGGAAAAPGWGGAAAAAAGGMGPPAGVGPSTRRRRSSSGGSAGGDAQHPGQPAASKAQPIPEPEGGSGRMTRAQAARARAEAQARAEEAAAARSRARRSSGAAAAAGGDGGGGGPGSSGPVSEDHDMTGSEDDHDLMLRDSPGSSEDPGAHGMGGMGADDVMDDDDDGYFDHEIERDDSADEDDDMGDEDGELDVGSMPVHDLHLTDAAATSAMAAAAAAAAAADKAAADGAAAALAAAAAGAASAQQPPAPAAGAAAGAAAGSSRAPWGRPAGSSGGGGMTAAAVAAAGAGPKLVFMINDQPMLPTATVFQAIQQSAMATNGDAFLDDGMGDDGAGGTAARRPAQLWDSIYTMTYRLASPEDAEVFAAAAAAGPGCMAGPSRLASGNMAAAAAGAARGGGGPGSRRQSGDRLAAADGSCGGSIRSHWRDTPLGELLTSQLPEELAAPQSCLDILRLLRLLEVVNRLAPRLLTSQELTLLVNGANGAAAAAAKQPEDRASAQGKKQQQASPAQQEQQQQQYDSAADQVMASSQEVVALAVDQAHDGQMALAHVHRDEFINPKLGNKLAQQLKDVLSVCGGGIPAWCHLLTLSCRFLFPFEVRRRYFYLTAFGINRALHNLNQQQAAEGGAGTLERDGRELRIGRLARHKVRVSRRRILDSAVKVMEMYARSRSVLELEYFGEVGTGLGPTLEFYTMLSHELQRRALGMWRHEEPPAADQQQQQQVDGRKQQDQQQQEAQKPAVQQRPADAGAAPAAATTAAAGPVALHQEVTSHEQAAASAADYVYAPHGLFPTPLPSAQRAPGSSVVEHFRLLGRAVAKALQDNRLLDLPLNPVFFRAALGRSLDLYDVVEVDPGLGASLERLARAAAAHVASGRVGPIMVDGCAVEDLCLTFTLPGIPSYQLCPDGADALVDSSNLVGYIQAVVDATLGAGIEAQLQAFREGFNEVFNLHALDVFREDEMEVLLCGAGEHWSPQQLADSMKFDHGYTSQSVPVRHLLEVLSELDTSDQRRFLRFVTGCPRLPPGGIAALQPRLTVVRKHPSLLPHSDGPTPGTTPSNTTFGDWGNGTPLADGDLPSVMTCANYIKLPPYSCKQIMRERLMFAIREGQGSFDLS